jgi:hypothetical protein
METKTFDVKEKSIIEFFKENSIYQIDYNQIYEGRASKYSLFKDEIIIKKTKEFEKCGIVTFEISDYGRGSEKKLINKYTYELKSYDDVSVMLTLVNFEIKLVNK